MELDIHTGLIFGGDDKPTVFAKCFTTDLCLLFRFSFSHQLPESIPSRMVACYHDLRQREGEAFQNRDAMQEALYSLVDRVWPEC
jgi:hypothetical protein